MYNRNYGGLDYVQVHSELLTLVLKPKFFANLPVTDGYTKPLCVIKAVNLKKDIYYRFKLELSRLIRKEGFETISKDTQMIDRIFNLLTEGKYVEKTEGILISTEIIKFGGDMNEKEAKQIYHKILEWWNLAETKLFN